MVLCPLAKNVSALSLLHKYRPRTKGQEKVEKDSDDPMPAHAIGALQWTVPLLAGDTSIPVAPVTSQKNVRELEETWRRGRGELHAVRISLFSSLSCTVPLVIPILHLYSRCSLVIASVPKFIHLHSLTL